VTTTDTSRSAARRTATAADHNTAPLGLDVTRDFAKFLSGFKFDELPPPAIEESRRGVLDWIGCALAGSPHPTVSKLHAVLQAISATRQASVIGRGLKLGPTEAALANGQMSHVLDYDDTHMGGVVLHASAPILCALFPLLERGGYSGRDLVCAYVAGFEAGVRVGQSAPGHHSGGWHLTGTLGTLAAGAAAARLLGLDAKAMTHALGIAATQAAGLQQNRGTMCKSFHAGKSASNGLLAALLAQQGFDSSEEIIEGKRGFCRVYSNTAAPELVLDQIGQRFEITRNGHKPYACGVVLHPAIDAMVALAGKAARLPDEIERVELRVHPFAVSITGAADPKSGLQSKFSIYHAAAVAYLDRNAGIAQFSDARAAASDAVALRGKIEVTTDETFRKDQAEATLVARNGERVIAAIAHASGTVENPMTNGAIEEKFLANATPVIGADRARKIAALVWKLETMPDARELVALCE
jgi:2-methylcitrate dehydratase PrpD